MTTIQANGIGVHVQMVPASTMPAVDTAAPTVVMIHGIGQDSMASWYFTMAKPLSEAGLRSVLYDLRGHGQTERPARGYRLDDFVDDLEAVLAAVGVTGPVYLLGNSFGGTIAFAYAIRHADRVAGLVTIESVPPTRGWLSRVVLRMTKVKALLPIAKADGDTTAGAVARPEFAILAQTSLVDDLATGDLPDRAAISAVRCPVLCVFAGDSGVARFAPVVAELIPHARTVTVAGHRHSMLVDRPDLVRDLILPFLAQECRPGTADVAHHH